MGVKNQTRYEERARLKAGICLLWISLLFLPFMSFGQDLENTGILKWFPDQENVQPGAILVPENHFDPGSRKIQITYIVLKARDKSSNAYPMIYFSGGPGEQVLHPGTVRFLSNHPFNEKMDIILFDQRGIGFSSPLPDMSFASFDILAKDADEKEELELTRKMVREYQDQCQEMDIHPGFYNTMQNARDVGMLFEYLGYGKYNLFGGSYGTRLARVVQDLYPGFVHSSVLDSPAPLSGDFLLNRLGSYSLALDRIFDYCDQTAECKNEYPNLKDDYLRAISGLQENPAKVKFQDSIDFYINGQDGIYLLRRLLYRPDSREKAPRLIREFLVGAGPVVQEVLGFEYQLTGSLNLTMLLSVEKFENFNPQNSSEVIDARYRQFPLIPAKLGFFDAFYQAGMGWHDGLMPLAERKFEKSEVPTLIFVNRFDPVTPPENGYLFQEDLTHCTLLVLDEGGHGGGNRECKERVIMQYMLDPGGKLDTGCLHLYGE